MPFLIINLGSSVVWPELPKLTALQFDSGSRSCMILFSLFFFFLNFFWLGIAAGPLIRDIRESQVMGFGVSVETLRLTIMRSTKQWFVDTICSE